MPTLEKKPDRNCEQYDNKGQASKAEPIPDKEISPFEAQLAREIADFDRLVGNGGGQSALVGFPGKEIRDCGK